MLNDPLDLDAPVTGRALLWSQCVQTALLAEIVRLHRPLGPTPEGACRVLVAATLQGAPDMPAEAMPAAAAAWVADRLDAVT